MAPHTESDPLLSRSPERAGSDAHRRGRFLVSSAVAAVAILALAGASGLVFSTRGGLGAWLYDNPPSWMPWYGSLAPPPTDATRGKATFILHTYCKPKDAKYNYGDFWIDGEKEAYIVHHNYGTNNWFTKESAIKMERVVLDETTGERGYRVETDAVDFEFGFALRNVKTGEWFYEIGRGSEATLYNEPCAQQYGSYFNRVRTSMPDPHHIEYVMGSCDAKCPADFLDTANVPQLKLAQLGVGPSSAVVVGKSDDARLFTMHSVRMDWIRSAVQRDTLFAENENQARFIAGIFDAYGQDARTGEWDGGRYFLLMASLMVTRAANNDISLYIDEYKYYRFAAKCSYTKCSASTYNLAEMWNDPASQRWNSYNRFTKQFGYGWPMWNPLYTLAEKGDSRPEFHELGFSENAYLTTTTLHAAGTWGTDIDARRVTLVSGASCGDNDQWYSTCIRNFHPIADETVVPTKDEKIWIFGQLGGLGCGVGNCISMVKVRVFVDADQSLKIQAVGAARDRGFETEEQNKVVGTAEEDVHTTPRPYGKLFNTARYALCLGNKYTDRGCLSIGGIKWVLAPEMVPSLSAANPRANEAA